MIQKHRHLKRHSLFRKLPRTKVSFLGVGGLHGHVIRMGRSMLVTEYEVNDALERLACAAARAEG